MSIEKALYERAESACELCKASEPLFIYDIPPVSVPNTDTCILVCKTCRDQINGDDAMDTHHWRCLNDSMWSPVIAVQVMAWRMLNRIRDASWPQGLLDMLYLDDAALIWAKATGEGDEEGTALKHLDCNGAQLEPGDTVTLTKDLNVKGTSFTAKRGTSVRGISLVTDNAEHIEGKINGQQIVILTKFVKKSK